MLEKKNQVKMLNDLRSFGKYCVACKIIKTSDGGFPDIFFSFALTGACLVEVKRPGGSPRKLQENRIKKLNICGTQTFVCECWEDWVNTKRSLGLDNLHDIKEAHERNERLLSD